MTNSAIFLKKGVHLVHVVSAMLVPPAELLSEEEAVEAVENDCLSKSGNKR